MCTAWAQYCQSLFAFHGILRCGYKMKTIKCSADCLARAFPPPKKVQFYATLVLIIQWKETYINKCIVQYEEYYSLFFFF